MTEIRERLKLKARQERHAFGGNSVLCANNEDSDELLRQYYENVSFLWGKEAVFSDKMPFGRFKKRVKRKKIDDLTFWGMRVRWFCGNNPTEFDRLEA